MGRRQVVRHGVLIPACVGSNPTAPANFLSLDRLEPVQNSLDHLR